jgi:histidinol dehydrogenase
VFVGAWAPEAAGDYATGGNHTLPTAGYARGFSPLSLEAFGRKMQAQRLEPAGLERIRSAIETLAQSEGLPGHAASVRIRFEDSAQNATEAQR